MRDDRIWFAAGKALSPSTKRRRFGRRPRRNSEQNVQTHNHMAYETSNKLVVRVRKSQREVRHRKKSNSNSTDCERNLLTSLFKHENSNCNPPSNRTKPIFPEPHYRWKPATNEFTVVHRKLPQGGQKAKESNDVCVELEILKTSIQASVVNLHTEPSKPDEKETDLIKNLEEVEVSDVLKSVLEKEYKPIPARPSNPLRYKTELCRANDEGGFCRFGLFCTFAHGPAELRAIARHHKYKTELCRSYHSVGYCQYGARCHFVHDQDDGTSSIPTVATSLPAQPSLSASAPKVLQTLTPKNIATDQLLNFGNLEKLNLEREEENIKVDFTISPDIYSLPKDGPPTFMDFLLKSRNSKVAETSVVSPTYHIENDYFSILRKFMEPKENPSKDPWSSLITPSNWSPDLSTPPMDESWWKDSDQIPRLSWPSPSDTLMLTALSAVKPTFASSLTPDESDFTSGLLFPVLSAATEDFSMDFMSNIDRLL